VSGGELAGVRRLRRPGGGFTGNVVEGLVRAWEAGAWCAMAQRLRIAPTSDCRGGEARERQREREREIEWARRTPHYAGNLRRWSKATRGRRTVA
jgi:hypothetical protein